MISIRKNHSEDDGKMASVEVNKLAPDFELEDFTGNGFKLSDYRGKSNILIVLNRGFV
jgi:peroxiredoxin